MKNISLAAVEQEILAIRLGKRSPAFTNHMTSVKDYAALDFITQYTPICRECTVRVAKNSCTPRSPSYLVLKHSLQIRLIHNSLENANKVKRKELLKPYQHTRYFSRQQD